MAKRTILVVSGSPAERGLLEPVVRRLKARKDVKAIFEKIPPVNSAGDFGPVYEDVLMRLDVYKPDAVLVPCDRGEALAAATACFYSGIPFYHFIAGAAGLGHPDDVARQCISLMATWIFAESEMAVNRLVRIGVDRSRIIVTGTTHGDDLSLDDTYRKENLPPKYNLLLVHPCPGEDPAEMVGRALEAVKEDIFLLALHPNSEEGRDKILERLYYEEAKRNGWMKVTKSLPRMQFLDVLKNAHLFCSNSSSIAYEAPWLGTEVYNPSIRNLYRSSSVENSVRRGASDMVVKYLVDPPEVEALIGVFP